MSDEWQIAIEVGGNDVLLFDGETTLGRSDESDVVVDDTSVSRQHAAIRVQGGRVSLRDLGSSNGTIVNDEKIEGEVELGDGDHIQLGDRLVILRVRSTLSDLEGSPLAFGGAEPAVGSATTMLQKASLDLAMKAQAEGESAGSAASSEQSPTEIRPRAGLGGEGRSAVPAELAAALPDENPAATIRMPSSAPRAEETLPSSEADPKPIAPESKAKETPSFFRNLLDRFLGWLSF